MPSMLQHVRGMYDLREELIRNGVLEREGDHYRFAQDYAFSSTLNGCSRGAGAQCEWPIEWKDPSGRTLKELQGLEVNV